MLLLNDLLHWDSELLSPLANCCPEGADLSVMQNQIVFDWSENAPLYYEPNVFKSAIEQWAKAHKEDIGRLWYAIQLEYNPIENYNRFDDNKRKVDTTGKETGTSTSDRETSENSSGTVENTVSAFNASDYQPDTKVITETNSSGTDNTDNSFSTDNVGNSVDEFHGHVHGNIGVTTTQQMLQSEIELRRNFNFYQFVSSIFGRDLMLGLY